MLIIIRSGPYSSDCSASALDMALVTSAMEQPVTLLYQGDGVYNLIKGQTVSEDRRSLEKQLAALPLYGIEELWYCSRSLEDRQLAAAAVFDHARPLQVPVCELIASSNAVFTF